MKRAPKRGDIVRMSFDPAMGTEQRGVRPALVISADAFNKLGMAMVCLVTQGGDYARGAAMGSVACQHGDGYARSRAV